MDRNSKKAFTLIELIVSITILTMIMVTVMAIYVTSSDISIKSDINRVMQENIKTAIERISEDVRKNGIDGVSIHTPDTHCTSGFSEEGMFHQGNKLCTLDYEYYLGAQDLTGNWIRRDNAYCTELKNNCFLIMKKKTGEIIGPITNNLVSVKKLEFYMTSNPIDKVTIHLIMQPAVRKGLKSELVETTQLNFQTTITQRPF